MDRNYVEQVAQLEKQLKKVTAEWLETKNLLSRVLDEFENEEDIDNPEIIREIRDYLG